MSVCEDFDLKWAYMKKELYRLKAGRFYGDIDYEGKFVIEPIYDSIGDFPEELVDVQLDDKDEELI